MITPNSKVMGWGSRGRRALAVTATAAACALLAACGTTVHGTVAGASGQPGAPGSNQGLGEPGTQPLGGQSMPGSASGSGTSTTGGAMSAGGSPSSAGPESFGKSGKGGASAARGAPFLVGIPYSTSDQAALKALGGNGDIGDLQAEAIAVYTWVNAHGGVGGRPIKAVWTNENAALTSSEIATQACTDWVQDGHVDAALPGGPNVDMDAMRKCLGDAHVPSVSIQWHVQTRQPDLDSSPLWVEPLALPMESYARTYVDNLQAQGFFTGGKLGILYDDGPTWSAVERDVLEPELRRFHVQIVAKASYSIRSFGDVAPAQPALRSYALQFKNAGVDRVISFEPWQGWGFFMVQASHNDFHPKWGLSSQTDWSVSYATGLVPLDEMVGARYVGWSPVMDLQDMWKPATNPRWSRLRLCDGIYAAAGITRNGPAAEVFALALCDGLLDLAALGASVHGNLDRTTFPSAVDAGHWQSAFLPATTVSMAHRSGVTEVRSATWDAAHDVFVYAGPPTRVTP